MWVLWVQKILTHSKKVRLTLASLSFFYNFENSIYIDFCWFFNCWVCGNTGNYFLVNKKEKLLCK